MMDTESLKKIKQLTEKNIQDLSKKSDLSGADTKCALDGFKLIERIDMQLEGGMDMGENGYSQYSGHYMEPMPTPRQYSITSYRPSRAPMSRRSSMASGYYDDGRSSNNGMGYSRHSIGDRVVSCMEQMMDDAASDYERQQLHRFMEMIRSAE